jgi:hypothetical protein
MNHKAKDLIYQKAMDSFILVEAAKKGMGMIQTMMELAKQLGWLLKFKN